MAFAKIRNYLDTASPRRRKIIVRGGIALAILLLVLGIHYYLYFSTHESTDDAFVEAHVIPISPRVSGTVLKVYVNDNQDVQKGDPLVDIDPSDYEIALATAQAAYESAEAEAHQARGDVERYRQLEKQEELSRQKLDYAQLRAEKAAADLDAARARVDQAKLNLSWTKLAAPDAGHVTRKAVEPGAYVGTGQILLTIVPPERWVVANFKETQLTHMKPGQSAEIEVDAYPDEKFPAHIDSIQRGTGARFSVLPAENATGNFIKVVQRVPVKIVLERQPSLERPLVPGLSVEVKVRTK